MPEIHAGIQSMLGATLLVVAVVGIIIQAVRMVMAAIMQVEE